jgi:hypothetical protein
MGPGNLLPIFDDEIVNKKLSIAPLDVAMNSREASALAVVCRQTVFHIALQVGP